MVGEQNTILKPSPKKKLIDKLDGHYSSILKNSDEVIIVTDDSQDILFFNNGAEKTFGYNSEELLGRTLTTLLPSRFVDMHQKHIENFALSSDVARVKDKRTEIVGLRKDGIEFPAEASILKSTIDEGWIFTIFLRDITNRKRTEKKLNIEHEKLLKVNNELKDSLKKEEWLRTQLINAGRLASLGDMAAKISHEINNPLAIIAAETELQLLDNPQPELKESLENVLLNAHLIGVLTRNYMALARPSEIKMSRLNLGKIFLNSVESIRSLGSLKDVLISCSIMDQESEILGDSEKLAQVLRNLLMNAVQATSGMENGEITVETRISENTGAVIATIKDNGVGIAPEILENIFDPYFTTKAGGEGTGLGLAIARELIEEVHHGQLTAESISGEGSLFKIVIPAANKP
ncbi:MAG: PAS domain S-box protein [Candidatus Marinimicrobia bacterium]|nr:PAS domain S-box protein [Candidatus Neomarinimicrobiota bacterium]